jgi:hypothetical protein
MRFAIVYRPKNPPPPDQLPDPQAALGILQSAYPAG